MKLSYEAARERLYELQQFGIHLGLDTISSLLSELGNPQERLPVLHVAGTNGKGIRGRHHGVDSAGCRNPRWVVYISASS